MKLNWRPHQDMDYEAYIAEYKDFQFQVAEDGGEWSYAIITPHDGPNAFFDHSYEYGYTLDEAKKAAEEEADEIGYE